MVAMPDTPRGRHPSRHRPLAKASLTVKFKGSRCGALLLPVSLCFSPPSSAEGQRCRRIPKDWQGPPPPRACHLSPVLLSPLTLFWNFLLPSVELLLLGPQDVQSALRPHLGWGGGGVGG
jgi:hypothetical protein